GGVLLGPSVLGNSVTFANTIFPLRSVMVIETMANVGLLYFLFLVGVEMDITFIGTFCVWSFACEKVVPEDTGYVNGSSGDKKLLSNTHIQKVFVAATVVVVLSGFED
ncbi:cation/h(+) antiporter 15, partial [Quercus suber]